MKAHQTIFKQGGLRRIQTKKLKITSGLGFGFLDQWSIPICQIDKIDLGSVLDSEQSPIEFSIFYIFRERNEISTPGKIRSSLETNLIFTMEGDENTLCISCLINRSWCLTPILQARYYARKCFLSHFRPSGNSGDESLNIWKIETETNTHRHRWIASYELVFQAKTLKSTPWIFLAIH